MVAVSYLCYVDGDDSVHHFYKGGQAIVLKQFTALPFRDLKDSIIKWDTIPSNSVFEIIGLEWHSPIEQRVLIRSTDKKEYWRHLPMCRTWALPEDKLNPYSEWQWASPFYMTKGGEDVITSSALEIKKIATEYMIRSERKSVQILNGFGSLYELEANK